MKPASAAMIALLASDAPLFMPELVTVTLVDGTILRYTDSDRDIEYGGDTYSSGPVLFSRTSVKWETGFEVDVMNMRLAADESDLLAATPLLQAILSGAFDDANIQVDRLYSDTYGDWSAGTINIFTGNVSNIPEVGRSHASLEVKSRLERLNTPLPRNIFQAGCRWTLFDAGCTLSAASFDAAGTVASGSTALVVKSNLTDADDYFTLGRVLFTSGANAGVSRVVREYLNASGQLTFYVPLPAVPQIGDAFTAFAGCDKTMDTCENKFSNLVNFAGHPFVPVPEAAI